jgi:CIC family chloride channel protein
MRRLLNLFKNLQERNKLLILSLLVGIASGLAAVVLMKLIHLIQQLLASALAGSTHALLYLVLPGIGMLASLLLLKYVVKDSISHGVTKVLLAVSQNESRIKPHNMWSSILTSSVTIGFGGSVGAEAPIVYTGAAIGSNFARFAGMSHRSMTILIGCGAAGAIAGIFKAPLAGVLFTLEILLFNISMNSMMPLLLSTVSATVVSYVFLGHSLPFQCTLTPFSMWNIPFYILLGLVSGAVSLYFIRMTLWLEDRLGKVLNRYARWACCAAALGLLIFLFPPLYGEGYDSLGVLLNGGVVDMDGQTPLAFMLHWRWGVPVFFLLILLLKVFSMTLTNAGGGVGGTFGPTLFVGAITGFVVARIINLVFAGADISVPEQNFVLVGMAALMAGVMQAPMTAIFLIAEITGGYDLFLPLIIASCFSFGSIRLVEKYSIYTKRIAQSGKLLTHDNDQAVLTLLKTSDLVRDKYPRVSMTNTLGEFVDIISDSDAQVFPVLDARQHLKGIIEMDHVRKLMFESDKYGTLHVMDFMEAPPAIVFLDEKMESVMDKFDRTGAWRLPAVDSNMVYVGFLSKSRIMNAYRTELKEISQD